MSRKKTVPQLDISGDLSAKEFQEKLSKWFEERGLLSDLRTHLRSQMVAALKDTSLQFQPKQNISPKYHSITLLIAEYLLHQDYHYTLSVFTSEVPLVKHLSEALPTDGDSKEAPRFQRRDVNDILECLGFNNKSHDIDKICHLYLNNSEPLLICIIRVLLNNVDATRSNKVAGPSVSDKNVKSRHENVEEKEYDSDDTCNFSKDLKNVINVQLETDYIEVIKDEIKRWYESELERICSEEKKRYSDELADIEKKNQEDLERKERQFRDELAEQEKRIQANLMLRETEMLQKIKDAEQQRENMDEELRYKQQQINEQATQILEHRREADIRLTQLEERATLLRHQEEAIQESGQRLAEKSAELDAKEHEIVQKLKMLEEQRKVVSHHSRETEEELESIANTERTKYSNRSQSKTQLVRDLQRQCLELRKELNVTRQKHAKSENREDQLFLEQLQQENAELKGHINQLRLRNIELTNHAANLAREYEDAQVTITLLSTYPQTSEHPIPLQPPPTLPPSTGELGAQASRHLRSRPHRCLRQPSAHQSGSSSESSPTEEIIRESHLRLRRLEEESEAVDRSYREFRLKTSSSLLQSISSPSQWKDIDSPPAFNYKYPFVKDSRYQKSDLNSIPNTILRSNINRRSDIFSSSNSDANLSQERLVTFDDSLKIVDDQTGVLEIVQTPGRVAETENEIQSQQMYPTLNSSTIVSKENIPPSISGTAPGISECHTGPVNEILREISQHTNRTQANSDIEISQRISTPSHSNGSEPKSKHSEIQDDVPSNVRPSENTVPSRPASAVSDKSLRVSDTNLIPSTSQQLFDNQVIVTNNAPQITLAKKISPPKETKVDDLSLTSAEEVSSDQWRLSAGESSKDDDNFW